MWIMISGPYSTGTFTDEEKSANLDILNRAAYELFRMGHTPIVGASLALPIAVAVGPHVYDEVMMPLCIALTERCDAVLRIGGPSKGADEEVECFRASGRPIFGSIEEIPLA